MICSVIQKWYFHFYLSAHGNFGFFSCAGYLHPKDYIKGVKNTFLNFGQVHDVPFSPITYVNALAIHCIKTSTSIVYIDTQCKNKTEISYVMLIRNREIFHNQPGSKARLD